MDATTTQYIYMISQDTHWLVVSAVVITSILILDFLRRLIMPRRV